MINSFILCDAEEFYLERELLHRVIFPKITNICLDQLNYDLNVIDPVDDQINGDKICNQFYLNAVKSMKNCSDGPLLIALIGEKNPQFSIPQRIKKSHYDVILDNLKSIHHEFWIVLQTKYFINDNNTEYIFREIGIDNQEVSALQKAINDGCLLCIQNSQFSQEELSFYYKSNLEQFLDLLNADNEIADRTICLIRPFRMLDGIPLKEVEKDPSLMDKAYFGLKKPNIFQEENQSPIEKLKVFSRMRELRECFFRLTSRDFAMRCGLHSTSLKEMVNLLNNENPIEKDKEILKLLIKVEANCHFEEPRSLHQIHLEPDVSLIEYLTGFCEHIFSVIQGSINQIPVKISSKIRDPNYQVAIAEMEMSIHQSMLTFCKVDNPMEDLARDLEWELDVLSKCRDKEIETLRNYIQTKVSHPCLILGPFGSMKSTLLSWTISEFRRINESINSNDTQAQSSVMEKWANILQPNQKVKKPVIVIRKVGTTESSLKLQSLLMSISEEIFRELQPSKCQDVEFCSICEYAEVVRVFGQALGMASASRPILVVIDDIQNLFPHSHTGLFQWLPYKFANEFVHIVLSSSQINHQISFINRFSSEYLILLRGLCELQPMYREVLVEKLNLTKDRKNFVFESLELNSTPLYIKTLKSLLSLQEFSTFNSSKNISDLICKYYKLIMDNISSDFVKISFSRLLHYLALSRIGLTFAELESLMKEDSEIQIVLDNTLKTKRAPLGKLLQLLISKGLEGFGDFLNPVRIEGKIIWRFISESHRIAMLDLAGLSCTEQTKVNQNDEDNFYNSSHTTPKSQSYHSLLLDFWLGKLKTNSRRNQLYFWQSSKNATNNNNLMISTPISYHINRRKLTELPFQQVKMGSVQIRAFIANVVCSHDFILSKLQLSRRPNELLAELYFCRLVPELRSNSEMDMFLMVLRELSERLQTDPICFSAELAGRLGHLAGSDEAPLLGRDLLMNIDSCASKSNQILPALSVCYSPILRPSLLQVNYFKQIGSKSIAVFNPDHRHVLTLVNSAVNLVAILWDAKSLTKLKVFDLGRFPNHIFDRILFPPSQDHFVLVRYRMTKEAKNRTAGFWLIDMRNGVIEHEYLIVSPQVIPNIVSITKTSVLISRVEENEYLSDPEFQPKVLQAIGIPSGQSLDPKISFLANPCFIVSDIGYYITPLSALKKTSAKLMKVFGSNSLAVRSMNYPDKLLTTLECALSPRSFANTTHGDFLFVGMKNLGHIARFDLHILLKRDVKSLKPSLELNLEQSLSRMLDVPLDLLETCVCNGYPRFDWPEDTFKLISLSRNQLAVVRMQLSSDDKFVCVEYLVSGIRRITSVWNLNNKNLLVGITSNKNSVYRFGIDNSANVLLHFVRGDSEDILVNRKKEFILEIVDLTIGQKNQASNDKFECIRKIKKLFDEPIEEARVIRGGSLVVVTGGKILLTNLSTLLIEDESFGQPNQNIYIGQSLVSPVFDKNLEILYSNSSKSSEIFKYYNIRTQKLISIGGMQTEDPGLEFLPVFGGSLLQPTPFERHISSDGKKLALVYKLKTDNNNIAYESKLPFNPVDDKTARPFQKPDIPGFNYFTNNSEEPYKLGERNKPINLKKLNGMKNMFGNQNHDPELAYERTVIKLFDITKPALLSQVSLCGEKVLFLASEYGLFTLKPDHASEMKFDSVEDTDKKPAQTILSRYSVIDGAYAGCSHIENPIINGSGLVEKDKRYIVCCGVNGRWIKSYLKPDFKIIELEVNVETAIRNSDEYARIPKVNRIFLFPTSPNQVLLQFKWKNTDKEMNFAKLNLLKRHYSEILMSHFSGPKQLLDVNPEGTLGIDTELRLYDLNQGELLRQINVLNIAKNVTTTKNEIFSAKIGANKSYIFAVMKPIGAFNAWLVAIKISPLTGYPIVGKVSLNCPAYNGKNQNDTRPVEIDITEDGQMIICLIGSETEREFLVFSIKDQNWERNTLELERIEHDYTNPIERIGRLMPKSIMNSQPKVIDLMVANIRLPG